MKLLFDTHAFIWWDNDPARLSAKALVLCSDPENELILSVTSLWEMQIKRQLGKLNLRLPLAEIVAQQQATNGLSLLAITQVHILALDGLPTPHKDPFDRLLIAQATAEGIALVSNDLVFASYPVQVIW
ncbi:MAG: type II toxin-antitoxin system VapC family toxin [Chloroflexi bacterium]|nr:type II toxin-antitoxin system VapC family toxin [Chloroflexota bacterium]